MVFTLGVFEWCGSEAVAVLQSPGPLPACLGSEPASLLPLHLPLTDCLAVVCGGREKQFHT